MSFFQKKKLSPAVRLSKKLKELRQERGISLSQLERLTNISKAHLQAMEEHNFAALPEGHIYKKHFVKRYLEALDIDHHPYIKQLEDEELSYIKESSGTHPKKHVNLFLFSNIPAGLRVIGVTSLLFLVAGYLGLQVKRIVDPPQLTLISPQNGQVIQETHIVVQGETDQEVKVSINGTEIRNNERGQFQEAVDLAPGLNAITITAEKKHGKITSETRYVVLKQDQTL